MRYFATTLVLATALLAACTGLSERLSTAVDHDHAEARQTIDATAAGDARPRAGADSVIVKNTLWLSGTTIKLDRADTLPPVFLQPATFDSDVGSLAEFAERISRLTHIPTRVSPNATGDAQTSARGGAAAMVPVLGSVPPLPTVAGLDASRGSALGPNAVMGLATPTHISYRHGDLRGLLDAASARFGVSWKLANGAILFYFTDTRTFQVSAIPGDASVNASVMSGATSDNSAGSGGSSTSGTGTNSNQPSVSATNTANTVVNSQLSVFNSLSASIKAMLSHYGSVVSSPATGSITVTDTPDVLDQVGKFMEAQNRSLSKQVLINVTVLSVDLTDDDSYGINWGAVYQALGTSFSLANTFSTTAVNPVSFTAQVITPNSRASGTQAMISALSEQGKVRRKTSASITTLNDQPVPVQVATQQGYLASVSITNTANVGSQTALTPGTVTTGFNMTLLPHVLDNGTVLLQFYTNISSLLQLQTVQSGGQQIQTPEIDTRNFLQRVSMKSGQTLVLSGYEAVNDNLKKSGVGTPSNYALGGGYQGTRERQEIVILITPIMMNGA
ncbi:PilN family type IVB pilus formation outer membrane protein [Trinickia caryophylli]|uniref:Type IVB pilus formation outer membrane protein, R64 PilN family n=1 Tax=Trinickia caryophylli TaxID=28094 RepID=A0A1X7EDN4_TRICW|nr:PilN family type IVB pilus formation outer membrane protein [Trinickia caryophylli]PMS12873.1 PilN family type IVB pilus formation outer membrane protein [Trinickia caryophylli]TRX14624.1 PilN family type IVB pilus formation outer membrane protein [Trinickia caryophylli]WQE14468.1 PilN family type IVB pilus formation outer membrane protein [Trinickia caryophylli]SMF32121.1 type IVB pilus formation outer membrane protein, R64 PilN family [Trinickia caryophylli]GLU32129.1 type IVB pilus forma